MTEELPLRLDTVKAVARSPLLKVAIPPDHSSVACHEKVSHWVLGTVIMAASSEQKASEN